MERKASAKSGEPVHANVRAGRVPPEPAQRLFVAVNEYGWALEDVGHKAAPLLE